MSSVLVIDDEEGITEVIQEALSLYGYDVQTACDGNEGIQKFKDQLFDVVITDIMMPNTDGNSVVRYIRDSSRRTTPIIGMSGTPLLLNDSDFDKVLFKPFPLQSLINTVRTFPPVADFEKVRLRACA
ncbi:MAG: response regulator [Desulfobacterales bacterium]|jgi:DNA-binding response OmpR family regulator